MTTLDHVLKVLREHQPELRRRGVLHAGVFGSVARGEERPDSDVDILVEIDPERRVTLLQYVGIADDLGDWIGKRVDLSERDCLKARILPHALRDCVDAF